MHSSVVHIVLLLALVVATPAAAGTPATEDPDTTVARRLFERGLEDYQRSDYQAALRAFEAAIALKPSPALHFNIARCADRLGIWKRAADEYEQYLPSASAEERASLRERVHVLRGRLLAPAPTAPPVPGGEAVARPDWLGRSAIAVGVFAVAAAAVGGGLYGSARSDFDELQRSCRLQPCHPPDWASVDQRAAGAYASWAIAGVAVAADVALLIARSRRKRAVAALVPAGAGVALGGAF